MRVFFFTCFLLFGFVTCLYGQSDTTIYLKDGSKLKGELIEDTDFFIKLKLYTGDTLTVGYKYISTQSKTIYSPLPKVPRTHTEKKLLLSANFYSKLLDEGPVDIGLSIGKRASKKWNYGGSVYFGNYFKRFVGVSIDPSVLSVMGFARRYFTTPESKPRWYTNVETGIGIPISSQNFFVEEEDYSIIPQVRWGIGVHFPTRRKYRILLEGGVFYAHRRGIINGVPNPFGQGGLLTIEFVDNNISPFIGMKVEL